tara:strand:- start:7647 stop:12647 length:5001 start_codon:yes stop_codon:yes gene_type:complete
MAKSINTFLKSRMNKDLDARLLPNGEYRDAVNVQISKSEGDGVGTVENVLGNQLLFDIATITGNSNLYCIGNFTDEQSNRVFLFFTDNARQYASENYIPTGIGSNHYIFMCDPRALKPTLLVTGPFLNFSQLNQITGVNLLENLLFFTDNRNQPRKINVDLANTQGLISTATYYTAEDQISVAKYNPYDCMQLYQASELADAFETTMKDVSSKFLPNGGEAKFVSAISTTKIVVSGLVGDIQEFSGGTGSVYGAGSPVGYTDISSGKIIVISGATVSSVTPSGNQWEIEITGGVFPGSPTLGTTQKIVFNPNPYYDPDFPGDPDYLEDKFVRFSYRFKFDDNEYSVFAPFTQIAFIPKQDGYFMYVKENTNNIQEKDDQADAYRSTVVYFVENKVDSIKLRIPLPFLNYELQDSLKVNEIEILYKESQGLAVKAVDTITVDQVNDSAGNFTVDSSATVGSKTEFTVSNIKGGVPVGGLIDGLNISGKPKITSFKPTNANNVSSGGVIAIDLLEPNVTDGTVLTVNDSYYYDYVYQSKKPFKTLPENNLTRVYDKIPVRALGQEVAGNRVIYANFQNKHTPPQSLNYNVSVSQKSDFNINSQITSIDPSGGFTPPDDKTLDLDTTIGAVPKIGDFLSISSGSGTVPAGTQVTSVVEIKTPPAKIRVTLNKSVSNISTSTVLVFRQGGNVENKTSLIEYPNSSLKQNRNYQVGLVLSDRYSRTSSVILSNRKTIGSTTGFLNDTVYSPYLDGSINDANWPGDSLKIQFHDTIKSFFNRALGTPGLYNGDPESVDYNPLGWYSWKVVVKQTEQEYYNVYLPGIMASYPEDTTLELGSTSHAVLINDNINKVPRDLNEVGPQQRNFASSVQLFGRVQNTSVSINTNGTNIGEANEPFYPGKLTDTVSLIATASDMFEYNPILGKVPRPNYFPQFYSVESNPFIARINTERQIGQKSTTNYNTITATIAQSATTSLLKLQDISGGNGNPLNHGILVGDRVLGNNFSNETVVIGTGFTPGSDRGNFTITAATTSNTISVSPAVPSTVIPGDLVNGPGVPAGTAVVSVSSSDITLTNVVDVLINAVVSIAAADALSIGTIDSSGTQAPTPVIVEVGQTVVVQPAANPGLQYLAVYETEPVESLLDIYWETSSSGLISDLNNSIINPVQGGASLANVNTAPFTEALAVEANLGTSAVSVTQAPITILDNFGFPVDPSDINSFVLTHVINQVQLLPGSEGVLGNPYFELFQIGSLNQFEIRLDEGFIPAIYYGEEDSSAPFAGSPYRNFNLTLVANINNVNSTFNVPLSLANVSPTIAEPLPGAQIVKSIREENIVDIKAQNGAAQPGFQSRFADGSCQITEISVASTGANITSSNMFTVTQQAVTEGGIGTEGFAKWTVQKNPNIDVPADIFNLTVQVQDAGGVNDAATVSFSINYGVVVQNIVQYSFKQTFSRVDCDGGSITDFWYNDVTIFQVGFGAPIDLQGFYAYNGPWRSSTAWVNQNVINNVYVGPNSYTNNISWFNSQFPQSCASGQTSGFFTPSCNIFGAGQLGPIVSSGGNQGGGDVPSDFNGSTSIEQDGYNLIINTTARNTPVVDLRTETSGTYTLLYHATSVNDLLQMWKDQRSSEAILRFEFENGKYASGLGWSNTIQSVQDPIDISGGPYNANQYVFTLV